MSRFFFILLLVLAAIVRGPLSLLLIVIKNIHPKLKERFDFERKNFLEIDNVCRSNKLDNLVADYCFEVSSEGELEQVRPLIEFFIKKNKRVEILFASPSVESKCLKMARDHQDLIRVLRLPIVTHFFLFQTASKWMSAKKLIFCRYDFFPELLILKFFGVKFILVSAAGKNPSWFKSEVYRLFNVIIAANKKEEQYFQTHFKKAKVNQFDFRIPRIFERIGKSQQTLEAINSLTSYLDFLRLRPKNSNFIMGSAWESDFGILKSNEWRGVLASGEVHLLIVPHDLRPKSIEQMKKHLWDLFKGIPVYEITRMGSDFDPAIPGIVLLNLSGVLCELYTMFECSYVGGGYARSIHSVLEPYLAGCRVFIGPSIHRSTEYDFIAEISPNEIHLLNNPDSFYNLFNLNRMIPPDLSARQCQRLLASEKKEQIIKEIETC